MNFRAVAGVARNADAPDVELDPEELCRPNKCEAELDIACCSKVEKFDFPKLRNELDEVEKSGFGVLKSNL